MSQRALECAANPGKAVSTSRIALLDVWRGLAIIGVVAFHFAWDLEFFRFAPAGLTGRTGWIVFARGLAGSFMFLVGAGLYLGHAGGIRWRAFARRFTRIAFAAVAITAVTLLATPGAFIYFGILHAIALCSILGLAFLRLPWLLTGGAGALFLFGRDLLASGFFNAPAWYWTGLSTLYPVSNDYVPVFPWFGVVLLGMAVAKWVARNGVLERLGKLQLSSSPFREIALVGHHTLAIYLLHQPFLIAILYLTLELRR